MMEIVLTNGTRLNIPTERVKATPSAFIVVRSEGATTIPRFKVHHADTGSFDRKVEPVR